MKIKVSDYIAQFVVDSGISHCFTVVGGGAMHLNNSFGHQDGLKCIYNHHEQASAMAAEAYYRTNNKLALCCVTTGPGGTNAITGVVGAWLDSIPMLVISGQVRYDMTVRGSGLPLRSLGDQEFDICSSVSCMTKYCEMVTDPLSIRYCLQKAFYIAKEGRPGPVWIDVPMNVQSSIIDTDDLYPDFEAPENKYTVDDNTVDELIEKIRASKRPVIIAGSAIRTSGAYEKFRELIELLNVPVTTCWNSIDLIEDEHRLYVGRGGNMGDRPGNFAVQNSDFVLALGSRLSIRQVGYDYKTWAREAYVAVVDVDETELKKHTVHIDMPICADVNSVIEKLVDKLSVAPMASKTEWVEKCNQWKREYPVIRPEHYQDNDMTNVYAFVGKLSEFIPENYITVVGNGSACVVGSHAYKIKKGSRFIISSAIASMGYDLPAAIGVCASNDNKELVCISGDGSIQMNLQELQTIITNKMPVKIFIINNGGYHSMRQTQSHFFDKNFAGIGPESGDLDFPDFEKLAWAYGYPYARCTGNAELDEVINKAFEKPGAFIAEIVVGTHQFFEPKASSKVLENGKMVSMPLEELAPFLPDEEMDKIMIIPRINNNG